jgi:predicted PurR-regulated permease PerM
VTRARRSKDLLDEETAVARLLPDWLRAAAAYAVAVLLVGTTLWFVALALLRVTLLSGALAAALLLTALLTPFHDRLQRLGIPRALSALASIVVLLGVPGAVMLLLYSRVSSQVSGLAAAVKLGIEDIRDWLIDGPLSLDADQVTRLRDAALGFLDGIAPSPMTGATTALRLLSGTVLAVFAVFFLLKDGGQMWQWVQTWAPARRRGQIAAAGEQAWTTLRAYVRGTVLIAAADAAGIGLALLLLGVPLWLSLALLTFVGGFVPLLGATVAGAVAVLVTLVTEGGRDAVLALVAVLLVQQVEGNLLQPLVMGRVIDLHPLVIVAAVTCGALLLGVLGALVAVPLVAVAYRVARQFRFPETSPSGSP